MSVRDRAFEEAFLEGAERRAGLHGLGFGELVATRLEMVGRRHGDRWAGMAPRELVHEIRAEALDLGGWPVLTAQRLMALELDDDCSLGARMKLQEIAAKGVEVELLVRELAGLIESVRPPGRRH